jgi:hypothetical protein
VFKDKKASRGNTVVEHVSHHPKVEGYSQGATAGTWEGESGKK